MSQPRHGPWSCFPQPKVFCTKCVLSQLPACLQDDAAPDHCFVADAACDGNPPLARPVNLAQCMLLRTPATMHCPGRWQAACRCGSTCRIHLRLIWIHRGHTRLVCKAMQTPSSSVLASCSSWALQAAGGMHRPGRKMIPQSCWAPSDRDIDSLSLLYNCRLCRRSSAKMQPSPCPSAVLQKASMWKCTMLLEHAVPCRKYALCALRSA